MYACFPKSRAVFVILLVWEVLFIASSTFPVREHNISLLSVENRSPDISSSYRAAVSIAMESSGGPPGDWDISYYSKICILKVL